MTNPTTESPLDEAILAPFVVVSYHDDWVHADGKATQVFDTTKIDMIQVKFSPEQWWAMASREGEEYIGGCCGTTSAAQDVLCGIHRDGGFIRGSTLLELEAHLQQHEGFEIWANDAPIADIQAVIAAWADDSVSGWDKLGAAWQVVKRKWHLALPRTEAKNDVDEFRRAQRIASNSLFYLTHSALFFGGRDDEPHQGHANAALLNARLLPILHTLLKGIQDTAPFEGTAIVNKTMPLTEEAIWENRRGLCIYRYKREAEEALQSIAKWNKESGFDPTHYDLVPVTITPSQGVVFG